MIAGIIALFIIITLSAVKIYTDIVYGYARKVYIIDENRNGTSVNIKEYKQAPGPVPWPIIGNLGLLGRYQIPFQGLTELSEELGDIYSLTLGTRRCLVINSLDIIREVLNQKGKFFGGRPDFLRYNILFGGDRNNSLALCDWSNLQQKRRNLSRRHCSPRNSLYFIKMSNVACLEVGKLKSILKEKVNNSQEFALKPLIQQTCANMFIQYMCSVRFDYNDHDFKKIVEYFDEIFWEINQGYVMDFLPWLAPVYKKHTDTISNWSTTIRKFILERVINQRERILDLNEPEKDFTDALLKILIEDKNVSRDTIIFMLEDFIGGHSAIGNLVMIALAHIAHNAEIGKRIQMEADLVSNNGARLINLNDMNRMPYTMATVFEVLRFSSSPIVPHVATEDTVVSGYGVTKDTIVLINNYKLNSSSKYWKNPDLFQPERFLDYNNATPNSKEKLDVSQKRRNSEGSDSGVEFEKEDTKTLTFPRKGTHINRTSKQQNNHISHLKKNIPHFLPFSIGKRTCIGQSLVRGFGFILLANILQEYDVCSKNLASITTIPACVALPIKTFSLTLKMRSGFNLY